MTPVSIEKLISLNQKQLDQLYAASSAGEFPEGVLNGKAMFFSGSPMNAPMAWIARLFWKGKVFNIKNKTLLNRVLGMHVIKARVYRGESWFDTQESIIIDYQNTSLIFGWVRDEIRQIGPTLYLGRAYARTKSKNCLVVNFALERPVAMI